MSKHTANVKAELTLLRRLIGTQDPRGLQDMRDIVATVENSHAALVEACETALANLAPIYPGDHLVIRRLRAALAKAEG